MNLTSEVTLRRFTNADLEEVMNINRCCLPENYSANFYLDIYRNCPDAFVVAEAQGRLVGYVMCRTESGFSDFVRMRPVRKGHIVSVAVMPEYRRLGIARSLMSSAIAALSTYGCSEAFVEVRVTNEPAIQLYRKVGFEVVRRIPRYYYDGEDAYVMSFQIGSQFWTKS
ncbi:ribosomal protein S18-alanine N-acetyltransferase [Candidatus Bathyarchaeota archaeon]|nr:ribosomal protein S18-alanine N-acetyltransferase [Candidatus Bathyarchaeota archaeon]